MVCFGTYFGSLIKINPPYVHLSVQGEGGWGINQTVIWEESF